MHHVKPTTEGRYAVVSPDGEQLHVVEQRWNAEMHVERLNEAASKYTDKPRWADRMAA